MTRLVCCVISVALIGVAPPDSYAQESGSHLEPQPAPSEARTAKEAERARAAGLGWERQRPRSTAHAQMPNAVHASTPIRPAVWAELSGAGRRHEFCDARFHVGGRWSSSLLLNQARLGSQGGGVFPSPPLAEAFESSAGSMDVSEEVAHDAWSPAFATASSSNATGHLVPLFPSASDAALQGFARVINHSGDAGEVRIEPVDDTGVPYGPLTLSIDGHQTVHFNSNDLEDGNPGKGLTGSTGAGTGDWRLTLTSDLDVEVLSYIRTTDGFLTAMHDVAPESEPGVRRVVIFNPGSNTSQVSRLRLLNTGARLPQPGGVRAGDGTGGGMTLSLKIAVPPRSRFADSAPPARFESGRRASDVVGRSGTARCRAIHGACAPKVNCPLKRVRSNVLASVES